MKSNYHWWRKKPISKASKKKLERFIKLDLRRIKYRKA